MSDTTPDTPTFKTAQGQAMDPSFVQTPTLPLPPPSSPDETHRYVLAVASAPESQRPVVRDMLERVHDCAAFAALLHGQLTDGHEGDPGYHHVVLSLIGGIRSETSIPVLEGYIWAVGREGGAAPKPDEPAGTTDSTFLPHHSMAPRAAEMLVWIVGWDLTRFERLLTQHPASSVRIAAIDALEYQAAADPDRIEQLRRSVRPEDAWVVGAPRRSAFDASADFDEAVARHVAESPRPPLPVEQAEDDDVR